MASLPAVTLSIEIFLSARLILIFYIQLHLRLPATRQKRHMSKSTIRRCAMPMLD
ncbi:hypothetical protein CLOSTMETH_00952 [[Clostridium] methylpentosum DSM 5476]|uniref:Uncharacterized protein n=1 Tax=[Clostridium] methylpentosum DSM 5476 TaxID=537013 RepID=C0EAT9_9FIRM|nr:hypothetical protein CLOSTMETH_00952 [[Clostridium] methylpentosum DSM 5476]